MKKPNIARNVFFLFFFILIGLSASGFALETVLSSTSNTGGAIGYSSSADSKWSQSFIPIASSVDNISFYHTKSGSPSHGIEVRIETDNSGKPSGTLVDPLASVIITPVASTDNYYVFNDSIPVTEGSTYWIVQQRSDGSLSTSNYWVSSANSNTNDYPNGTRSWLNQGSGTWTNANYDLRGTIYYGDDPVSTFFDVTAKDAETSATLYNITVTLENGTQYTNASSSIVVTPFNDSSLQNFTISVDTYFNQTFTNYNTSVDLQANLTRYPYIKLDNAYNGGDINTFDIMLFTGQQSSFGDPATGFVSVTNETLGPYFYFEYNDTINVSVAVEGARTTETQYLPQITNKINHSVYYPKAYLALSNFVEEGGVNYTRQLDYNFTVSYCAQAGQDLTVSVNGTTIYSNSIVSGCQSYSVVNSSFSGTYNPSTEGSFYIYANMTSNVTEQQDFMADLNNATAVLTIPTAEQGFVNNFTGEFSLTCTDTIYPTIEYNLSLNFEELFFGNLSSGTLQTNTTDINDGNNYAYGSCSDAFGTTSTSNNFTAYIKTLNIIHEKLGTPLDMANLTQVRAWFDDNSTFYDFKAEGTTSVNVIGVNETKIRLELQYPNGDLIVRYLDLLYIQDSNFSVCGMPNGTTYYEQLLISASEKVAINKNQYTNCYIAADTTRFAYQDTNLLRAFTIDSSYYIYTYDNGQQVLLASLDGSITSAINLDRLQFALTAYDFSIDSGAISVDKTGDTEMRFYYKNLNGDLLGAQLNITRMDTNTLILSTSDFVNPNEFTMYFDYGTLLNVTNETIFKVSFSTEAPAGASTSYVRYFNTDGDLGILTDGVAIGLSLALALFGLTMGSARLAFSWLGAIVMVGAIGVLSMAAGSAVTLFLLALYVIIFVYIIISMVFQNQATLV